MTVPEISLSAEDEQWLAEVAAESIGWQILGNDAYLHIGAPDEAIIHVVGVPDVSMAAMNLLWCG